MQSGSIGQAFSKISDDFKKDPDFLFYHKTFNIETNILELLIDIQLGAGFEGGYARTNIKSMLLAEPTFRFAIQDEDWLDEIGKFFGMEDVEIGYADFDEKLVIKTDDKQAIRSFFENQEYRAVFESLKNFSLSITHHLDGNYLSQPFLELEVEDALATVESLKPVFYGFCEILKQIKFVK